MATDLPITKNFLDGYVSKQVCPNCNQHTIFTADRKDLDTVLFYQCLNCHFQFYEHESQTRLRAQKREAEKEFSWSTGIGILLLMVVTIIIIDMNKTAEDKTNVFFHKRELVSVL